MLMIYRRVCVYKACTSCPEPYVNVFSVLIFLAVAVYSRWLGSVQKDVIETKTTPAKDCIWKAVTLAGFCMTVAITAFAPSRVSQSRFKKLVKPEYTI